MSVEGVDTIDALESAECEDALGRDEELDDEEELLLDEDELDDEEELLLDEDELEEDELALRRLVAANAGLAVVSMSPAMNAAARNDFAVVLIRYV